MSSAPLDFTPSPLGLTIAKSRRVTLSLVTSSPSPAPCWVVKSSTVASMPAPFTVTPGTSRLSPSVSVKRPAPSSTVSPGLARISASCSFSCAPAPASTLWVAARTGAADSNSAAVTAVRIMSLSLAGEDDAPRSLSQPVASILRTWTGCYTVQGKKTAPCAIRPAPCGENRNLVHGRCHLAGRHRHLARANRHLVRS